MAELTQDQARKLADGFLDAAEAVSDFRFNQPSLTDQDKAALDGQIKQLSDKSNELTAKALQLTLADLQPTLDHLAAVTGKVNDAIAKLNDVRKVINIAANFVALGTAIASGNPGGIAAAAQGTVKAVQDAVGPPVTP